MSFYICHCGNTKDNHNFRHPYENVAHVTYDNCYTIDADDFPIKTTTKCSKPNCSADRRIHGTQLLEHKYEPVTYTYREIRFTLPEDTKCCKPGCVILSEHRKITSHIFSTKVYIKNQQENDKVYITDPEDEDNKIIWS